MLIQEPLHAGPRESTRPLDAGASAQPQAAPARGSRHAPTRPVDFATTVRLLGIGFWVITGAFGVYWIVSLGVRGDKVLFSLHALSTGLLLVLTAVRGAWTELLHVLPQRVQQCAGAGAGLVRERPWLQWSQAFMYIVVGGFLVEPDERQEQQTFGMEVIGVATFLLGLLSGILHMILVCQEGEARSSDIERDDLARGLTRGVIPERPLTPSTSSRLSASGGAPAPALAEREASDEGPPLRSTGSVGLMPDVPRWGGSASSGAAQQQAGLDYTQNPFDSSPKAADGARRSINETYAR